MSFYAQLVDEHGEPMSEKVEVDWDVEVQPIASGVSKATVAFGPFCLEVKRRGVAALQVVDEEGTEMYLHMLDMVLTTGEMVSHNRQRVREDEA